MSKRRTVTTRPPSLHPTQREHLVSGKLKQKPTRQQNTGKAALLRAVSHW